MSTRYPTHAHTLGATFSRVALVKLPAGSWTPSAVIQTRAGRIIETLDCTLQALTSPDPAGNTHALSVFSSAAQAADWPLGELMWITSFTDASVDPVIVPAVTRVVQVSAYTTPAAVADDPLAAITDFFAPVLRGEKGDKGEPGDAGGGAGAVSSVAGRTGDVVLTSSDVGLGSVDNTADADKPVSTAQAAADTAVLNAAAADATAKANAASAASDPAGTAASAVGAHTSASDPHPQYVLESTIGQAGGIAPLDGTGKVASAYLPSYVDDVIEVANYAALPGTGETGKIYIALDTNKEYRWSGSVYIELVASPGSTDAVPEGSTNLYHTAARVRSTVLTGLSTALGTVVTAAHTVLEAIGFLQKQVSDNTTAISGKQATLVSGTNIKTINSTSLLGSGDLTVSASPGGSTTQVQYNSAGAFAGASGITTTGTELAIASGTQTTSQPVIDLSQTWNAAGVTFTGIKANFTKTAASDGSMLFDFKMGNTSRISAPLRNGVPSLFIGNGANTGLSHVANGKVALGFNGGGEDGIGVSIQQGAVFGWGGYGSATIAAIDTGFSRNAAGVVEINNGTAGAYRDLKLRNLIGTGNLATGIVAKTAAYTATTNDHTITVDASGGAVTITGFACSGNAGKRLTIKKTDSSGNAVTFDPNAAELVDGASTKATSTQNSGFTVQVNAAGTEWAVVATF